MVESNAMEALSTYLGTLDQISDLEIQAAVEIVNNLEPQLQPLT